MKPNFADQTRNVLVMAREEAERLKHDYVGTEHILLSLLRQTEGLAIEVLRNLAVEPSSIRERVEALVRVGRAGPSQGELPYTSRAKKILEYSMAEARERGHSYIGVEHLLLGVLREEKGIAAQVLNSLGVTLDRARQEVMRLLRGTGAEQEASLRIDIDDASDQSIYEQIVHQVQEAIATGELKAGMRLPPVRRLADELDIAPGTVARAYSALERLGVLATDGARGTWVAQKSPTSEQSPDTDALVGLLRPVAVAAFHMGAGAQDLRVALEIAMEGIFEGGTAGQG
jgi:DNA-binding transcriptional regulator YhcF (GntR family)